MSSTPKLVTHPLGLAGYALGLVFGLIAKFGPSEGRPWLVPTAIGLAAVCIVGGLLLAKMDISKRRSGAQPNAGVTQNTTGDQSPAISSTIGNVSINYGDGGKKNK